MNNNNSNWTWLRSGLVAVACAALLAGCGSSGRLQGPSGPFAELKPTQANEALVVFFREEGTAGRVPLVLANDRVVGSLLDGRYAQARICAGTLMAGTADRADVVGVPKYQALNVRAGEAVYLQVSETAAGQFELRPLDAAMARERLDKLKVASHIINRHVPDCTPKAAAAPLVAKPATAPAAAVAVPVVLKRVQLGADALFAFDRHGEGDMLPAGRNALIKLVDDIQRSGVAVERLRLVGHTDRLGTPAYNAALSQRRADTVAAFLRKAGLTMPIEAQGKGEEEPVTSGCVGERASAQLIACLQPDRRVTVDLIGTVQQSGPTPAR